MIRKLVALALGVACLIAVTAGSAQAKTTVKCATLAPKASPWGKVFLKWSDIVKSKTDGGVEMEWLWNGTAGPEHAVVGKMKSGQIGCAAVTAVGLSSIDKSVLALQVPGTFKSWGDLDKARNKLAKKFKKNMKKEDFYVLGWGDVGKARVMSVGFAVKSPDDLKGKSPAAIKDDVIAPAIYEVIGGVTPKPGAVTDFLPMLQNKTINVMNTPALAAEQLQWASRLDHMNTAETAYAIGALVVTEQTLKDMPADQAKVMKRYGKKAAKRLTKNIRAADDAAFNRLKKKMNTHDPSEAEKEQWKKVFKAACKKLKTSLPGDVLSQIGAC